MLGQCGTKDIKKTKLQMNTNQGNIFCEAIKILRRPGQNKKTTEKSKILTKKGSVKKELPVNVLLSNLF